MLKILLLFLSLFSISSANETIMEVIPLHNRPASELLPLISPLLEGPEHIIDNGSNLIVKASTARLEEIKLLITKLDTGLSNLSITVIQSKTATAEDLNASANIRLHIPLDHPSNLSGRIIGRYANTEDINSNDSTQVIRTVEGRAAYIKIGKIHPIHNYTIYGWDQRYPAVSSNTQFIETTTGFVVTPRLTDQQVTMEVSPWSDKMNDQDTIEIQRAKTTLRVNLGEWVEIGDISEQSQARKSGFIAHTYSTKNTQTRILIKVEKLN
jgi:type II secretory pathway component GspD/PulD (secretin)